MKINISHNNKIIFENIRLAKYSWQKMKGLMFVPFDFDYNGLFIKGSGQSIHTFFMKFSLDVYFLDKKNTIIHIIYDMKPWRASKIVWNSKSVLEIPTHKRNENYDFKVGDTLELNYV